MSDKELKSFKIGDNQSAGISSPVSAKANAAADSPESQSVGFARIEKILEDETPETIGEKLNSLISELETYGNEASTNKDKLAAEKAVGAVEKVADLMDYLFQTKGSIESNP